MNKNACFFVGLILLFSACKTEMYKISNDFDFDIKGKPFVVSRNEIIPFLNDSIQPVCAKTGDGTWLTSQCDDLNGDGIWDELAFLCDLKANESIKIRFEKPDSTIKFPVRTNIRFGRMNKPFEEVTGDLRMKTNDTKFSAPVYQMEGPAWENDIIAFRNYYDARNGIDIFGKLTNLMVMDSVGVNGREYHTLHEWGMDILKVGNSLGAGAIAIGVGDSLYRIGPCDEGTYKLITEGPVRSILQLVYKKVPAGARSYDVVHEISIYAGDSFYRSKVSVSGLKGDEELVTGIVNLHNVDADTLSEGNMKILYALGNQGFSGERLGMGVIFPADLFKGYSEAPDSGTGIVNTHLVKLKLSEGNAVQYRFVAVWENRDPLINEKDHFVGRLKEAAYR